MDSRFSSNEFFQKTIYYHALELLAEKDYETAYTLLGTLNTPQALQLITDSFYELRQQLAAQGNYLTAYRLLCRLKEQIPNAEALCADTLRLLRKHPPQGLLIAESYFTIGVIPGEAPLLATQYPPHWWTRELPLGKPVSVAANDLIALGVQADGTVQFASDSNYQGEPFYSTPESWQNITSAAVGRYLAVGLKADGLRRRCRRAGRHPAPPNRSVARHFLYCRRRKQHCRHQRTRRAFRRRPAEPLP